jgi:hypothetical protein
MTMKVSSFIFSWSPITSLAIGTMVPLGICRVCNYETYALLVCVYKCRLTKQTKSVVEFIEKKQNK